ncbi:hypothetical protein C1T17_02755 [Sphingobium sp. SCG-1]|uniref:TonB-dependent receptor n=1 Tax=Sphingobium sp. SCG-1 TaxID=2072936 RepID=UPI000CD67B34|nr:TonB-dependent receptor [Sphingobium sp. SCG-1]AUW57166.1 hypothetical protein C1T17_02755 [Sphingobium sp. SCG-1]
MITWKLLLISTAGSVLGLSVSATALAQSADAAPQEAGRQAYGLVDIIVTARKREESSQRVPIAISNINAEQLSGLGITRPEQLATYVPGLVFRSSASDTSVRFSLRGQVSSDNLLTIAPAVGVYVDNGNVPHPIGLNGAMFDIARVEVLKGPQGTLYGRNTTGGAINILTRGADFGSDHGYVAIELGNHESRRLSAALNTALAENILALRVAGQYWSREGFGTSLVTGQKYGGDRNDVVLRGSLLFTPSETVTSTSKLEYVKMDRGGYFNQLVAIAGQASRTEIGLESGCATSVGNITPTSPSFNLRTALAFGGCSSAALNNALNTGSIFKNNANANNTEIAETWHAVQDMTFDLSDDVRVRSITSYHKASYIQTADFDGSPFQILEFFAGTGGGVQPEVRYVSDGVNPIPGGTSVLPNGTVVGFPFEYGLPQGPTQSYYQWSQEFNLGGKAVDGKLNWLVGAFGSYDKGFGSEPNVAFSAATGGGVDAGSNTTKIASKSWGIYTQNDFQFTDQFSVTGGLRYSRDYQNLDSQPLNFNAVTGVYTCTGVPPAANTLAPSNDPTACPIVSNSIQAGGWSYLASVNFQATPGILVYAKTSRGFRGGSLQLRSAFLPGANPEFATDYELGLKGDFLDRHLRLNLAAYHTKLKSKQESITVPSCDTCSSTRTIIFNAADARVNGFEAEATAVLVRGLTLNASAAMVDSKYTSWANAPDQNTGGTFNAAGLPFREPKYTYTLSARYENQIGAGLASASLTWAWQSRGRLTRLQFPLDGSFPISEIERLTAARGLLSGRIDYNLADHELIFAVSGTNLLNDKYQFGPFFNKSLGIGTANAAEPRMIVFSITKKFGAE